MSNISLVTFAAKTVTPQDDALVYESALGAGGIIYGAEVTIKNANTLHINAGHGVICGRKFTIYDADIPVALSSSGTLLGRLYIHLDLSNASDPIELLTETGQTLSPLEQDENVNIVNGIYDINIASFTVSTSTIANLRNVYPKVSYANSGSLITITTEEPSLIGEEVTVTDGTDYVYAVFNAEGVAELKNVLMTGTLTVSATDGTDIASASLNVPYYGAYTLDLAFWGATLAISTPNSELYGQQITIKNSSDETVGTTQFGGSGTASYVVKEPDTYTVSVTYGGVTFSSSVVVTTQTTYNVSISTIPDGATVTPTDDIQIWLNCGGIFNLNYTSLSEVLADTTTLLALVNDNNAADYMARSTTWAADVTADQTAMTYIGADDYCADTLLADSTWLNAICNSTYFESVLNVKVPTMTGNTTPSGECFASTHDDIAYLAFDNNSSTNWGTNVENTTNHFVGYDFGFNVKIYKWVATVRGTNSVTPQYRFQYLNESNVWTQVGEIHEVATAWNTSQTFSEIAGTGVCQKARMFDPTLKTSGNGSSWIELQFYGRIAS